MHIYNIKAALKDAFYGTPTILGWTPKQDARALAAMSIGVSHLRASNGQAYWYFFLKDINDRDLVRFLMQRNGLKPEFHMSKYYEYVGKTPAFRVRMTDISKYYYLGKFTNDIKMFFDSEEKTAADVARYIDTIKTKLDAQRHKTR